MFCSQSENSDGTQKIHRKNSSIKTSHSYTKSAVLTNLPVVLTEHQKPSPSTSVGRHEFFPRKILTILKFFLLLIVFWQKPALFWLILEKIVKVLSKIKTSTEIFWTHKMKFWQFFEVVAPKSQNTFLTAQRRWKNSWIFVEITLQSKISTGHTECSFDKAVENFYPRSPEVQNWRKKLKKFVFKHQFFLKFSPGNLEKVFTNLSQNFRRKSKKIVPEVQK